MTLRPPPVVLDLIGNTALVPVAGLDSRPRRTIRSDVGKGHPADYQDDAARLANEIREADMDDLRDDLAQALAAV